MYRPIGIIFNLMYLTLISFLIVASSLFIGMWDETFKYQCEVSGSQLIGQEKLELKVKKYRFLKNYLENSYGDMSVISDSSALIAIQYGFRTFDQIELVEGTDYLLIGYKTSGIEGVPYRKVKFNLNTNNLKLYFYDVEDLAGSCKSTF